MKKLLILLLCLFTTDSFGSGIASNSASAPCTNNTLETYSGNSNLAADWAPNTIQLRWYNENEKLTVQQSAQTCTYDGTLTVPQTPPTRTGYTFAGWEVKHTIPAEYTELEYLESSGTQWIDIEIVPSLTYSIEVKAKKEVGRSLFGSYAYNFTGSTPFHYWYLGTMDGAYKKDFPNIINNSVSHVWGFDAQRSKIYCDDIVVDVVVGGESPIGNLWLFARNYSGGIDPGSHQIYYVKLWNSSNQLIFHGIPARRNSDNVLGMWDTVTQTFFTNAGTGSFIAGPAVTE